MLLSDLDRPIIEYEYEPWKRTVRLRVLSAGQFVSVMRAIEAAGEDDSAAKIAAMAKVCELGILDPQATAEQWQDVRIETLMHLGNEVLAQTSETNGDEAKKN